MPSSAVAWMLKAVRAFDFSVQDASFRAQGLGLGVQLLFSLLTLRLSESSRVKLKRSCMCMRMYVCICVYIYIYINLYLYDRISGEFGGAPASVRVPFKFQDL